MFKRILVPVDGSEQAMHAAAVGIAMAACGGAKVLALEVLQPQPSVTWVADALIGRHDGHDARAVDRARQHMADVASLAQGTTVPLEEGYVFDRRPYTAIVSAAFRASCDLIVVGASEYAHGHHVQLSHEVTRLLSSTDVPVLVCR